MDFWNRRSGRPRPDQAANHREGSARQLEKIADQPELYQILLEHAYRGVRVQLLLRAVLVVFAALVIGFVPPVHDRTTCVVIVVIYAGWSIGVGLMTARGGEAPVRYIWLALFVDVLAFAALTLVAGSSAEQSWTAHLIINGFFLIPVIAATQLRPWVCGMVAVPTLAVYLGSSIATKQANTEPWSSILLRTSILAGLCIGGVLLSRVQLSRVLTIARLVAQRSNLLAEIISVEERERRELAENLHDGALQYVLAARQDLEDARDTADPESFDRVELALKESAQLLRSTMTELHPAVLQQSGLAHAVRELARTARARGGFIVEIDSDGWPEELRTTADTLLLATVRELLTNVVKHAGAGTVRIALDLSDGIARLEIADDGRGIADGELARQLGEGHVGLTARRVRVEAAGGRFELGANRPTGTVVRVEVPAQELKPI
ncbi:MAG: putative two-component histidine kinase [Pseudonocardiales bacterium]|nr:putative two-component histidine kinase [Pseudonocardiales bacterium]